MALAAGSVQAPPATQRVGIVQLTGFVWVLSRGEAKDSALLSSRDAGLLEPPERLKGLQPAFLLSLFILESFTDSGY